MATVRELMVYVESETALDVVAIADHDQVEGALEAVEWCAGRPGGRVQAIVATEISAAWGRHVLALFFDEPFPTRPLPRFRSLATTIRLVGDLGGLAVIPHPLSPLVPSVGERALAALLAQRPGGTEVPGGRLSALTGIEVCSGVVGGRSAEARLRRLNAARWRLAELGSSDAHHLAQVGAAYTVFPGRLPGDLRGAILERHTVPQWGPPAQVGVGSHLRQNWRSLVLKPARELRSAVRSAYANRPGAAGELRRGSAKR
jgi:hypothetical protein